MPWGFSFVVFVVFVVIRIESINGKGHEVEGKNCITRPVLRALAAAVVLSLLLLIFLRADLHGKGEIDLLQYYTSATLLLSGENPYDAKLISEFQRGIHGGAKDTVLMWNPPLLLPLIAPFALLSFSSLVKVWFACSLLLFFCAGVISWNAVHAVVPTSLKYNRGDEIIFLALLLTFYPPYDSLTWGQLSAVPLLGLALFLHFSFSEYAGGRRSFLAGFALALTLVKPHLLYLLYLHLLTQAARSRSWQTIAGFLSGALLLSGIPLIFNVDIYLLYLQAFDSPPIYWQTPTLGSWLQLLSSQHTLFIRTLPTLISASAYLLWAWPQRKRQIGPQALFFIIPLSLVSAPYGWLYDQSLLIPSLIWMAVILKQRKSLFSVPIAILLCFHLGMFVLRFPQQYYVWYPLLLTLLLGATSRAPHRHVKPVDLKF